MLYDDALLPTVGATSTAGLWRGPRAKYWGRFEASTEPAKPSRHWSADASTCSSPHWNAVEDGLTLIRRIRNMPPATGGRIPALALTAYARSEDRIAALMAGFQMHLTKFRVVQFPRQ